jgi:hypothetical protein
MGWRTRNLGILRHSFCSSESNCAQNNVAATGLGGMCSSWDDGQFADKTRGSRAMVDQTKSKHQ